MKMKLFVCLLAVLWAMSGCGKKEEEPAPRIPMPSEPNIIRQADAGSSMPANTSPHQDVFRVF